jgi:hypothetical protein
MPKDRSSAAPHDFSWFIAEIEAFVKKILISAGLPDTHKPVRIQADGKWVDDIAEDQPLQSFNFGETVYTGVALAEERCGVDSPEWWAAKILESVAHTKKLIAAGDADAAATAGVHLGVLVAKCEFRFAWGQEANIGAKVLRARSNSGKGKADRHRQHYAEIRAKANEFWQEHPGKKGNITAAAKHIRANWLPQWSSKPLSEARIRHIIAPSLS